MRGLVIERWIVVAAWIVAAQYICALLLGLYVGFAYPFPRSYAPAALGISIFLLCGLALAKVVQFIIEREPLPTQRLKRELWRPDIPIGVALVAAQMAVLGCAKVTLPYATSFWTDPPLAQLDAMLFFGVDPWRISHALFGGASHLIDRAYITWAPINLSLTALLLILPQSEKRAQALLSYFVIMAGSIALMYAIPAAGPIFYADLGYGDRFADLPLHPWVESTRHYLWTGYLNPDDRIGSGISAMPSVHVAVACWMALVCRLYLPKAQMLGWAFLAVILVGSVHLGWHYAVDGLAGIGITAAAWWLCRSRDLQSNAQTFAPQVS